MALEVFMLEKPNLEDEKIIHCLKWAYGLPVTKIAFLPLGADLNTAVYRATTHDKTPYFVKLRRGDFDETAVTVPQYLHDHGLKQIVPALMTRTGQLWTELPPFKVILYPFIEGKDGYERPLTDPQWLEFGTALKQFHTAVIPTTITNSIKREAFSPRWRDTVKMFLARIKKETFTEPVAAATAVFLQSKQTELHDLVQRTEQLAQNLQANPPEFILCHADIHAWNLLITDEGTLYMVDWDTLIFAPKERDLMFVGGGLGGNGRTPQEEETLFYQGYGHTQINPIALAYYRYERIIEDIAIECEQLFLSDDDGEDRIQALANMKSNFRPKGTIAMAQQADKH
jgi:spectinomycin phosphotransferase